MSLRRKYFDLEFFDLVSPKKPVQKFRPPMTSLKIDVIEKMTSANFGLFSL